MLVMNCQEFLKNFSADIFFSFPYNIIKYDKNGILSIENIKKMCYIFNRGGNTQRGAFQGVIKWVFFRIWITDWVQCS